jgi:HK97 gp10 family phage protein
MPAEIKIEGMAELQRNIDQVVKNLRPEQVNPKVMASARIVANEMRRRAPVGATGNLRRAIVAKLLDAQGYFSPRAGFAGIDRAKKGYHAHLVEYGSQVRRPKEKKVLASKALMGLGWGQIYGTEAAPMPAHPFLRPAADATMPQAYAYMETELKKMVENF